MLLHVAAAWYNLSGWKAQNWNKSVKSVCTSSEESFVVMDYATLENVEVEVGEEVEGRMSPPAKNSSHHHLSFKLLMSKNNEGRSEHISLMAESRYWCAHLPSATCSVQFGSFKWEFIFWKHKIWVYDTSVLLSHFGLCLNKLKVVSGKPLSSIPIEWPRKGGWQLVSDSLCWQKSEYQPKQLQCIGSFTWNTFACPHMYSGLSCVGRRVHRFFFLSRLPRVDRARWIVALMEQKKAGDFICTEGKSTRCICKEVYHYLKYTEHYNSGPFLSC